VSFLLQQRRKIRALCERFSDLPDLVYKLF